MAVTSHLSSPFGLKIREFEEKEAHFGLSKAPYSKKRIFYFDDGAQEFGRRKPDSAGKEKPKIIGR